MLLCYFVFVCDLIVMFVVMWLLLLFLGFLACRCCARVLLFVFGLFVVVFVVDDVVYCVCLFVYWLLGLTRCLVFRVVVMDCCWCFVSFVCFVLLLLIVVGVCLFYLVCFVVVLLCCCLFLRLLFVKILCVRGCCDGFVVLFVLLFVVVYRLLLCAICCVCLSCLRCGFVVVLMCLLCWLFMFCLLSLVCVCCDCYAHLRLLLFIVVACLCDVPCCVVDVVVVYMFFVCVFTVLVVMLVE